MLSQKIFEALVETGILLSAERSLDNLLYQTVENARQLFDAEGASLYLREGDKLNFRIFKNPELERRLGEKGIRAIYRAKPVDIGPGSIAGYTATIEEPLIVTDPYNIPQSAPFSFNPGFDKESGYVTRNLVSVSLRPRQRDPVGVLQLVNVPDAEKLINGNARAIQAFAAQAAIAVENTRLTEQLKQSQYETIHRLAAAAEFRDRDTGDHLKRMSSYSADIARTLGLPEDEVELVLFASPLHDVGKIGIPDEILLKPGPLDDAEWEVMKTHTTIGAQILADPDTVLLDAAHYIALCHHERFDGEGYPRGLPAKDIPLYARIVSVSDVYDALTSKRPYKDAFPHTQAIDIIMRGMEKGQFDPAVVDALVLTFEEMP